MTLVILFLVPLALSLVLAPVVLHDRAGMTHPQERPRSHPRDTFFPTN